MEDDSGDEEDKEDKDRAQEKVVEVEKGAPCDPKKG